LYNIFTLDNCETKLRRINFVYDAVARKIGKPLCPGWGCTCNLWMAKPDRKSMWATKEAQAKTLWYRLSFVNQSLLLRTLGFRNKAREIMFVQRNLEIFVLLVILNRFIESIRRLLMNITRTKDDTIREVLESAMGAGDQPLVYIITAGFNLKSVQIS
jgi:hypothetical protein